MLSPGEGGMAQVRRASDKSVVWDLLWPHWEEVSARMWQNILAGGTSGVNLSAAKSSELLGVVEHTLDPSSQEAEVGAPQVQIQSELY